MVRFCRWIPGVLLGLVFVATAVAEPIVRVATYNIENLKSTVSGERKANVRTVLEILDPHVIGLQEIKDRAAIRAVLPPEHDWQVMLDDDSGSPRDLAVAVRAPVRLVGVSEATVDIDAEDENFLFPDSDDNSSFPERRDVLVAELEVTGEGGQRQGPETFYVMVVHAKSRFGGRATTEPRRVSAARELVARLDEDYDEKSVILLGDFNDNPDDAAMNILETGNLSTPGGAEDVPGTFLVNLTEPLCAAGLVSHGRTGGNVINGRIDTVDPESRNRNNEFRGQDRHTGDILFDQILISPNLVEFQVAGSTAVFSHPSGVLGGSNAPSDHLPVSFELAIGFSEDGGTGAATTSVVRISGLLPNPDGEDRGHEQVLLLNTSSQPISLDGWSLVDKAEHKFALDGREVPADGELVITLPAGSLPLTNKGDEIRLFQGPELRQTVQYTRSQAGSGEIVRFE